jgi:hypothetical protein
VLVFPPPLPTVRHFRLARADFPLAAAKTSSIKRNPIQLADNEPLAILSKALDGPVNFFHGPGRGEPIRLTDVAGIDETSYSRVVRWSAWLESSRPPRPTTDWSQATVSDQECLTE